MSGFKSKTFHGFKDEKSGSRPCKRDRRNPVDDPFALVCDDSSSSSEDDFDFDPREKPFEQQQKEKMMMECDVCEDRVARPFAFACDDCKVFFSKTAEEGKVNKRNKKRKVVRRCVKVNTPALVAYTSRFSIPPCCKVKGCAKCRYDKCLEAGMKPEEEGEGGVKSLIPTSEKSAPQPSTSSSSMLLPTSSSSFPKMMSSIEASVREMLAADNARVVEEMVESRMGPMREELARKEAENKRLNEAVAEVNRKLSGAITALMPNGGGGGGGERVADDDNVV